MPDTQPIRFDVIRQALLADPQRRTNLLTNYRRSQGGRQLDKALAAAMAATTVGALGYSAARQVVAPITRASPSPDPEGVLASELENARQTKTSEADVLGHLVSNPMAPAKLLGVGGGGLLLTAILTKAMAKQNPVGPTRLAGLPADQAKQLSVKQVELDSLLQAERRLAKMSAAAAGRGLEMGAIGPSSLPASIIDKTAQLTDSTPRAGFVASPAALAIAGASGIAGTSALVGLLKGIANHKKRIAETRRTISRFDQLQPDQIALVSSDTVGDSPDRNVIQI